MSVSSTGPDEVPGSDDDSAGPVVPQTRRGRAKAARRAELLTAAARQMAERGFSGVRLEDIGRAVGVSGPAMYRHFASKSDLLDEMLVDISQRLHDGGAEVVARGGSPADILDRLIEFHIDVLVTRPDLIAVQDRDLSSMTPEANHRVRSLQRRYVEQWVDVVLACRAGRDGARASTGGADDRDAVRVRVHATFGLLNSSHRLPAFPPERLRPLLASMAIAALLGPDVPAAEPGPPAG